MIDKLVASVGQALHGLSDGTALMVGGFGIRLLGHGIRCARLSVTVASTSSRTAGALKFRPNVFVSERSSLGTVQC